MARDDSTGPSTQRATPRHQVAWRNRRGLSENRGDQGTIMLIEFSEEFDLPVADVYPYFRTPRDWQRLYGAFGDVGDRGDGWYAVPLRGFPFPLVARVTSDEPLRSVRWEFRGFWRGEGEVRFTPTPGGVAIQGYERITIRHLPWLAPLVERLLLESKFRKVWDSGWRRLRRQAAAGRASAVLAS